MIRALPTTRAARLAAADRFRSAGVEPGLSEFWTDPVFLAVLARDRLSLCDVHAAIARATPRTP